AGSLVRSRKKECFLATASPSPKSCLACTTKIGFHWRRNRLSSSIGNKRWRRQRLGLSNPRRINRCIVGTHKPPKYSRASRSFRAPTVAAGVVSELPPFDAIFFPIKHTFLADGLLKRCPSFSAVVCFWSPLCMRVTYVRANVCEWQG